jgi:hypothetical protein
MSVRALDQLLQFQALQPPVGYGVSARGGKVEGESALGGFDGTQKQVTSCDTMFKVNYFTRIRSTKLANLATPQGIALPSAVSLTLYMRCALLSHLARLPARRVLPTTAGTNQNLTGCPPMESSSLAKIATAKNARHALASSTPLNMPKYIQKKSS